MGSMPFVSHQSQQTRRGEIQRSCWATRFLTLNENWPQSLSRCRHRVSCKRCVRPKNTNSDSRYGHSRPPRTSCCSAMHEPASAPAVAGPTREPMVKEKGVQCNIIPISQGLDPVNGRTTAAGLVRSHCAGASKSRARPPWRPPPLALEDTS